MMISKMKRLAVVAFVIVTAMTFMPAVSAKASAKSYLTGVKVDMFHTDPAGSWITKTGTNSYAVTLYASPYYDSDGKEYGYDIFNLLKGSLDFDLGLYGKNAEYCSVKLSTDDNSALLIGTISNAVDEEVQDTTYLTDAQRVYRISLYPRPNSIGKTVNLTVKLGTSTKDGKTIKVRFKITIKRAYAKKICDSASVSNTITMKSGASKSRVSICCLDNLWEESSDTQEVNGKKIYVSSGMCKVSSSNTNVFTVKATGENLYKITAKKVTKKKTAWLNVVSCMKKKNGKPLTKKIKVVVTP